MSTGADNDIHYIYKVWETFIHDLHNFKTKPPIVTGPNPQEPPLEALQNDTKYNSALSRVWKLFQNNYVHSHHESTTVGTVLLVQIVNRGHSLSKFNLLL